MRDRYLRMLYQYKSDLLYYELYFQRTIRIGREIRIAASIISILSIALWTMKNDNAIVYGGIIVFAQVVSMIYEYLPYQHRVDEISTLKCRLQEIYTRMEHEWFYVDRGLYDDEKINNIRTEFCMESVDIESMFFQKDTLPRSLRILKRVDIEKNRYFENSF